jgi:Cft2 family RNA processing exonuclease
VLIPVASKSKTLHLLVLIEQIFAKNQKLRNIRSQDEERPVLYLEHLAPDTLDVAKSHLNWMNFQGCF